MASRVFGKFIKKNGYIYRTDTYMQFGDSDDIIGGCVLCNPGSSTLKDSELWRNREYETDYEYNSQELKKDNLIILSSLSNHIYKHRSFFRTLDILQLLFYYFLLIFFF